MYAQGLREEIIALQRRIKELEAQNHALASVLVQQLHQGSPILVPGEAISKVPAEGAGDEPLVAHTATSVSPHHTQNGTINSCPFHVHLIPLKPAFDTSHLTKPLAVILKQWNIAVMNIRLNPTRHLSGQLTWTHDRSPGQI